MYNKCGSVELVPKVCSHLSVALYMIIIAGVILKCEFFLYEMHIFISGEMSSVLSRSS
jgi:hypothetical protein